MRIPVALVPAKYAPLVTDSLVYGVSLGFLRLFGVIVTPLLARSLTPSEYGAFDAIVASTALLPGLMTMNVESGLVRYYYDATGEIERRRLVSSVVAFVAGFGSLVAAITCLAAPALARLILGSAVHGAAVRVAVVSSLLQLIATVLLWVLRLDRRLAAFLVCAGTFVAVSVPAIVLLLSVYHVGLIAYFDAVAVAAAAQCLVAAWFVRHHFTHCLSWRQLRTTLRFSLPVVPTVFASVLQGSIGRFLLLHFTTLEQVASFGLATRAANFAIAPFAPFQMAWQPYSMSVMRRPDAHEIYAQVTRHVCLGFAIIMTWAVFLAPEIAVVLGGPAYRNAATPLRFMIVGTIAAQMIFLFHVAITIAERPVLLLYATVAGLAVNASAGFFLTPALGSTGVAIAFVAGAVTMSGTTYFFAQRQARIDYPIRRIAAGLLIGLVGAALLWAFAPSLRSRIVGGAAVTCVQASLFLARTRAAGRARTSAPPAAL